VGVSFSAGNRGRKFSSVGQFFQPGLHFTTERLIAEEEV